MREHHRSVALLLVGATVTLVLAVGVMLARPAGTPVRLESATTSPSRTAEEVPPRSPAAEEVAPTTPDVEEVAPRPSRDAAATPSDGRPARALFSIPALGIEALPVVPYEGWTDDAPGTAIQNRGRAASPYGARGGVGPGGVGNFQVTAHRNTAGGPFFALPDLRVGQRVHVDVGATRFTYRITTTRETSFRSPRSLAAQRAAVPGRPGVEPTRAMITLSTCATQEDHAAGNYWADEFDNPEHRIDKVGVLVRSGPIAG